MQARLIAEQMRRKGLRRICVISGSESFRSAALREWQDDFPGDWLRVTTAATGHTEEVVAQRARQFLGQERLHAIYDATQGIHLEAFAALAGTLVAGSWLVVLMPIASALDTLLDHDSQRWAECEQPIATPIFYHYFWQQLEQAADTLIWREGEIKPLRLAQPTTDWQPQGAAQQRAIVAEIAALPTATCVVTAPRGRGKSALGGMLAAQYPPCLITGPAKISTAVIAHFAGEHYNFQSPDSILGQATAPDWRWLIIDEAASLPLPQLQALVERFPRCLLLTTTEGYEGTGQGFLLKLSALLAITQHYRLHEPQRYRACDPLETFIEKVLGQNNLAQVPYADGHSLHVRTYRPRDWHVEPRLALSTFQLLQAAHYRTTPTDLRRMMDAPHTGYYQLVVGESCYGALGWVDEGQQSVELAQAVWRGERRPRGNLVAQSLAAHSRFPQAMTLASRRISRIAISELLRRTGLGRRLVTAVIDESQDKDFVSVSFGFTPDLWQFWRRCGFQLVRIGTQREASSGCYAAMAIYPLSQAGQQLCQLAVRHFQRDWPLQQARYSPDITLATPINADNRFSADDYDELIGFARAHRPLSVSYPALWRASHAHPNLALGASLQHCLRHSQLPETYSHKQWLAQLRRETAALLTLLPEPH